MTGRKATVKVRENKDQSEGSLKAFPVIYGIPPTKCEAQPENKTFRVLVESYFVCAMDTGDFRCYHDGRIACKL